MFCFLADAKRTPFYSQSYNVIVGPMITISVRSSKIRDLQHWGRIICLTISLTSIGLRFVQKLENNQLILSVKNRHSDSLKFEGLAFI